MPDPLAPLRRLTAIPDPAKRAVAITKALADLPEVTAELREARQNAVLELRSDQGLSHAQVADLLKVSRARAQQIAEGRTTGKRRDPAEATEPTD
ncbi:sigma factor-like helix-turn-helix DNA-binding protein [Polymorphospora lycopeni]|uniref:Sigma factor-like helix-turn-helix DNA-binding protein n=1 Tax=Polymorphospora lycopeni TaxID=3140240 RepID=A0ABV5CL06_9ACTN